MGDEFRTRYLTMPDGTVARTVLRESDTQLSDEQILEKYPIFTNIAERWAAERAARAAAR